MGALFSKNRPANMLGVSDVERSERRRKALTASGAGVATVGGVTALLPFPPFAQIIGAGLAAVGGGISIAAKLRERGSLALAGDERAVAGFALKAAKWSSKRRARVAAKLAGKVKAQKARLAKRKRPSIPLKKKLAIEKLKLGVLVALEANAKADSTTALVKGEDATVPETADADPMADMDMPDDTASGDAVPTWAWVLGGLGVLGGVAILARPKKAA